MKYKSFTIPLLLVTLFFLGLYLFKTWDIPTRLPEAILIDSEWVLNSDDPFAEPVYIRVVDVKEGYIQYRYWLFGTTYGSTHSIRIRTFKDLYKPRNHEAEITSH